MEGSYADQPREREAMIGNYLEILEESLQKKLAVLEEISDYNEKQEQLLKQENVSLEDLDVNMEQKGDLVKKLSELDEGFETLYDRIKEQLLANRETYKEQIRRLQELISKVTEKSVSIRAQEARNKALIEKRFVKERSQIRQGRQSLKAAYSYYKNMSNSGEVQSRFLDQKK